MNKRNKKTVKKRKKENAFLSILKSSWSFLKDLRYYMLFSFCIFIFFILLGFFFPIFYVDQVIAMIKELVLKTQGLNTFELIKFIILNNSYSALMGILFGILFGIIPLGIMIMNGYVLGFVSNKAVEASGNILTLWQLLPHGIFEIPAIIISISLGIKLGFSLAYSFYRFYFRKLNNFWTYALVFFSIITVLIFPVVLFFTLYNEKLRKIFFYNLVNSFKVFVFIVIPMLIIAGIIEGGLIHLLG